MLVSVVCPDSVVVIDGVAAPVDCSDLPSFIRAIQWDSDAGRGHLEFERGSDGRVHPNLAITDFSPYDYFFDRHREALTSAAVKAREAELAEAEREARDAKNRAEQEAQMQAAAAEMQERAVVAIAAKQAADERVAAMEARIAALESQIAQKNSEVEAYAGK